MKRLAFLLATGTALFPMLAHAQAFTHPDGDQGANWNVLSSKPTGAAPADAFEVAEATEEVVYDEDDWIWETDGTTDYIQSPAAERKLRITCEPSTMEEMDFILGYGIEPFGHRHMATGKFNWNSTTNYTNGRADPSSTCSGGPLNATLYIEPELEEELSNGLIAGRRMQTQTFYYVGHIQSIANDATWLRRDTAFILGTNPKNFNDTARRAEYAASGFQYPGSAETHAGFGGWQCYRGDGTYMPVTRTNSQMLNSASGTRNSGFARHLKAEDGSDPWGGACTGSVAQPGELILNLAAPGCWDRHNTRAPDGRAHFWHQARKSDGSVEGACPTTDDGDDYGVVPVLQVKTHFKHAGFADYGNLFFSSDRMRMSTTECPDETEPCDGVSGGNVPATVDGVYYSRVSLDPCRATGLDFCNGATGHADWGYIWNSDIFEEAQRECLGISVRGIAPTHGPGECNTSQISKFRKLVYSGASPDPDLSGGCTTVLSCSNAVPGNLERFNPVEEGTSVPGPVDHILH